MKLYLLFVSFMASLGLSAALETTITSLELLFTRAFNAKIADGTWENIFGNIPDLIRQPFCAGGFVEWPIPAVEDGSDLANLLQLGTFYCAYNENARYVVSDGETETLLLETGTAANPYANGLIVDWWQELVDYVNTLQLGDVDLVVEWKLFPNSQASMDAVDSGEVHAACGNWAPDGVYTPLGWDERYSRAAFLSKQVCPSYLQNSWVWTPVELSIKTFGDLVDAIDGGKLSDFCVLGTRHGGFETSCQNSLDLFATGFVNCTGYNTAAFDVYEEGGCDAVWDGYPANFSEFKAIQQPFLYSPVTYFRQTAGPAEDPAQSDLTTLQLAFTHAFENKVADGTWADYFGDQRGMEATAFCTGHVEAWPLPDPMEGSDLKAVLDRGMFRCTYNTDVVYRSPGGEVLIDTTDPENVNGLVPDFFDEVVAQLGDSYGTELGLEWVLAPTTQDCFTSVHEGSSDAACGYWYATGTWTNPATNETVARPIAFNLLHCPTFYDSGNIITLSSSGIDSYGALVAAIQDAPGPVTICVHDDEFGAGVTACQDYLSNAAPTAVVACAGAPGDDPSVDSNALAIEGVDSGRCLAAWQAYTADEITYNIFQQSARATAVTFMRNKDMPGAIQNGDGDAAVAFGAALWPLIASGLHLLA